MAIIYLTLDQAIETHRRTIQVSGGGTVQCLDISKLESILEHIQNDDYYPTFEEKLTHLFFSTNKFHCFADGNKRIAIALCAGMLILNGYLHCIPAFFRDMENISYHVAAGRIGKVLLYEVISAALNADVDNESLKLKIFQAMSKNDR